MRHLDIGVLWLQEQQLRRVVELTKVLGTSNPADLMTKHLGQESLNQYAEVLQYDFRQGRSATTSRLHSALERAPRRPRPISSEGGDPRQSNGSAWAPTIGGALAKEPEHFAHPEQPGFSGARLLGASHVSFPSLQS